MDPDRQGRAEQMGPNGPRVGSRVGSPVPRPGAGRRPSIALAATALLVLSAAGAPADGAATAASSASFTWRTVRGLGPVDGIRDVAADGAGRVALADARGVVIAAAAPDASGSPTVRRIARLGIATRVRFDGEGGLFAVGEQGLLHVDAAGRESDRTPRLGQGGRALVALDVRDGWLAVGGGGGLLVARLAPPTATGAAGRAWLRVHEGLAAGLVSDVAIGATTRSGATPLWVVAEGELHLVWLDAASGRVTAGPARLQRPPGRPMGEPVRRVHVPVGDGEVRVLYARATARLVGPPLDRGAMAPARWELAFPLLPPEAELTGVAIAAGRTWLASTAGVLVGDVARAAFGRASAPAGARATVAIAAAGGALFAASPGELLRGDPAPPALLVRGSVDRMPRDPELALVHRRALERLGLRPREIDRLWRGLRRRAWLPSMSLQGGIDYTTDDTRDYDESFSYGQLNKLNDRNTARATDYGAGISLSWDFADLAYSPEAVDLSREARQVIGLRDNVLDEINQLYFDRQRSLRALSAYADWSDPEAAELRLRALELAAGLDAWTGGWFSTQIELPAAARAAWHAPPPIRPERPPAAHPPLAPAAVPIHHPVDPVPIHAGRDDP